MEKNMRSRKGVALVEVVIALVVIGIISVATLTVMFSSIQIENKTVVAMDVRNQAENAIECFRFADGDEGKFVACLNNTTVNNEPDFEETGDGTSIYVLDKGGYKTTITLTIEEQTAKDENNNDIKKMVMVAFKFVAEYKNISDNKEIYSFEFPKASTEGGITE